jgi:RimJ/RimL family protein N-acetyltransferase
VPNSSGGGRAPITLRAVLAHVRLRTPRLELRLGSEHELRELGELFRHGTYPDYMESVTSGLFFDGVKEANWVENFVAHHHSWLDESTPAEWYFNFLAFVGGKVIGSQGLQSRSGSSVFTNSLIGRRYQGRGYGTEMRAAVLSLAFAVLGARSAISDAWAGNEPSLAVSRKLGYLTVGTEVHHPRGEPVEHEVMRLEASRFRSPVAVEIDGAEAFANWTKPDAWVGSS